MVLVEYDWESLEAKYFENTILIGNVVKTQRVLQLYAKESPTSNTVIGGLVLGSPMMVGRELTMDLWEYIRSYMEENGPVMVKGDKPAPPHPRNIFQSAQLVAPYFWPLVVAGSIWSTMKYAEHGFNFTGRDS
jgi:hypothetical protein